MAMLEARIERVVYPGGRTGVGGVSILLEPGSVLLVAGPSGSGKSTLLKTLAGVIPFIEDARVEASIRVDGRAVESLPPRHRPIAYLPQEPGELALGDYGAETLLFYGAKPRLSVGDLLDKRVYEMSSGQLQRLILSTVTGQGRSIVLLDEPLANLDIDSSSQAYKTVEELVEEKVSVVVAEHRISRVASLADRILVLGGGGRQLFYGDVDKGLRVAEEIGVRPAREEPLPAATGDCTSARGEPVARLENVYAGYSGRLLFRGLDFTCPKGVLAAVIGPNGSGKSTLLKILAGILKPWRGRVHYSWGVWDWRMIGYVPASPWLSFIENTVLEEVANVARRAGSKTPVEDSLSMLEMVGLKSYAGEKPWRLSGGEMVRLAIARALVKKPRLLLLDEPLRGQDKWNALRIIEALRNMTGGDGCTLVVTHDLEFLGRFDTVYRIDRGCYTGWQNS